MRLPPVCSPQKQMYTSVFPVRREFLKLQSLDPSSLSEKALKQRLPQVHKVIYLMFTEGHCLPY